MLHFPDKMPARRIRKTDRVRIVQLGDRWWTWKRLAADDRIVAGTLASWRRADEAAKMARISNPGIRIELSDD